jgi:endonuclease/exonuclease/phosphatase family metal-dependent hydrolase
VTYNTHGNQIEDWSTNAPQVQAIGRQMSHLKPDIITFQEIPLTNTYQMANFVTAFLPGYFLATNSGTDGFIRSVILSRFPITRSQKWLDGVSLVPFGYTNSPSTFTRDLFEAQISVPGFKMPLHVFTTHLKSGQGSDDSARRGAEASAISNFFATGFLITNSARPYVVTGDMNEDIDRPPSSNPQSIERLISPPTGLKLTTPVNPFSASELTFDIRTTLTRRYDYILPGNILFTNMASSQIFRTDLLASPPPPLQADDDMTASDHLPVMMIFRNPYDTPFRLLAISVSNQVVTLRWESESNRIYGVESSADLFSWSVLVSNLTATGTNLSFSTNVTSELNFFRVYRVP